jgi:hypothetical protein
MGKKEPDHQQGQRRFRIWVAGRLGAEFTDGIDGLDQQDAEGATTLMGELADHSHIHGVLDRLRNLGVEVLRFETYRPDEQEPAAALDHTGHGEPPSADKPTQSNY